MDGPLIQTEIDSGVTLIMLARAEKLNAINPPMIADLHEAMDAAEADEDVHAIVLTGDGKSFSAGFDLDVGSDDDWSDDEFVRKELQRDFDIILRFWDSPKPTIAAVHGHCLGGAMELATACDITIAAESALFGAPEAAFGSGTVAMLLPWLVGPKQAKELLFTAEKDVTANRAREIGLVNRVCDDSDYLDESLALARSIAANDPHAVRLTKLAINRSMEVAGMREALAQALEIDVEIESSQISHSNGNS